jgi:CspA family cold shock protein
MTGTVKFFNSLKGYGFIKQDGCDAEWFCHVSGTMDKIEQDDRVSFDEFEGRKGPIAVNVKRIKENGK